MKRKLFYGVYLASESISTILDLVRFFAEPDGIRFSHITLRGPYSVNLPRTFLEKINSDPKYEWLVELKEPEGFFLDRQSTVVISVDLLTLTDVFYKKDYRDGIPHITLYDGPDRTFAIELLDLLKEYKWHHKSRVGRLTQIQKRKKLDEQFLPFFLQFRRYYSALVGNPGDIPHAKELSADKRLSYIRHILECCLLLSEGGSEDLKFPDEQEPEIPGQIARVLARARRRRA